MSKIPTSRLLEEIAARKKENTRQEEDKSSQSQEASLRETLSDSEKKEIWDVIQSTTAKVWELIKLLQWFNKTEQEGQDYYYESRWWYSQSQLREIRPLKNEVTAWYFEIWEKLRIHGILEWDRMQRYYNRIKSFKQNYHATTINSSDVIWFHEQIRAMIVPILRKAFK